LRDDKSVAKRSVKVIDDFGHHPTAIAYLKHCAIAFAEVGSGLSSNRAQHNAALSFNSSFRGGSWPMEFHRAGRQAGTIPEEERLDAERVVTPS
jgi:hypothetical protein